MAEETSEDKNPINSPFIRREAGEGWHPDGLNKSLLSALAVREAVADEFLRRPEEAEPSAQEIAESWAEYEFQRDRVEALKAELGIGDPPPIQEFIEEFVNKDQPPRTDP